MASVRVAIRVRPFNGRERQLDSRLVVEVKQNQVTLLPPKQEAEKSTLTGEKGKPHTFTFDHAYWSHNCQDPHFVNQTQVFTDLGQDVVKNAFDGYNVCVFAYGQTGSGKTYTMMGSENDRGLIPRICETMFQRMSAGKVEGTSYRTEVSYLEIYNERVKDLLAKNSTHNLKVREHPTNGPYVQDLSKHFAVEYRDILNLMEKGNQLRTTASTNMNDTSSRSHAIFTITFVQAGYMEGMPHETLSKIHLVDLAGSERANATGATGQRLKEGAHINKSLVTLGSVISALAEASKQHLNESSSSSKHFIPYRDSVLTWLLKDSLGGNSKTIMIATISPAEVNHNETLSTLRYANRAKNIINKPTVNEDANVKLIRELREEIDRLKAIMSGDPAILEKVQKQLAVKEAKEQKLTAEWNEKWRETAKILQEHNALGLKRTGLGVVLDSDKPHLIGLDEDILSTGLTLYQLSEGETVIGSAEADGIPHIILNGPGILPVHCVVRLEDGVATLQPKEGALCLVNAAPVDTPIRLSQGCVIVLGKTNMFRYNDPLEAADLRKNLTEKNRKASLINQSLLSQSLSDLRGGGGASGARHSGEWRMFSSDSDIKDIIAEGDGESCREGSNESITTLTNNQSSSNSAQTTPRAKNATSGESQSDRSNDTLSDGNLSQSSISRQEGVDENANPTNQSTPVAISSKAGLNDRILDESYCVSSTQEDPRGGVDGKPESKGATRRLSEGGDGEMSLSTSDHVSSTTPHTSNYSRLGSISPVESVEIVTQENVSDHLPTGGSTVIDRGAVMQTSSDARSESSQASSSALASLYQEINDQKEVIMACLEEDKCDIDQLNAEIAKLQDMQHRYSLLEFESTKSFIMSQSSDDVSFLQERFSQFIEAEVDRRLEAEADLRLEKEREERELLLLEKEQEMERMRLAHEREMYLIKKKLSAASTTAPSPSGNPSSGQRDCRIQIKIPRFYTVGTGSNSYVEYEVEITFLETEGLERLHRRYRQFRDLHKTMCNKHGPQVQFLNFPSKKIFNSKSEAVSCERQRDLQNYLNRLMSILSKTPTSPLYNAQTKESLASLSTFFQSSPMSPYRS